MRRRISVTIGVAYLIVVENLLGLVWDNAGQWLPADVVSAFAAGGTSLVSIEEASLLAVGHAMAGLFVMFFVFTRRDITE